MHSTEEANLDCVSSVAHPMKLSLALLPIATGAILRDPYDDCTSCIADTTKEWCWNGGGTCGAKNAGNCWSKGVSDDVSISQCTTCVDQKCAPPMCESCIVDPKMEWCWSSGPAGACAPVNGNCWGNGVSNSKTYTQCQHCSDAACYKKLRGSADIKIE